MEPWALGTRRWAPNRDAAAGGHAAGNSDASLCGILATGSAEEITTLGVTGPGNRSSELVAFARAMAPPDADAFGRPHLGDLVEMFARRDDAAGRALLGGLAPRMRLGGWVRTGPNSEAVGVVDMVPPIAAPAVRSLIEEVFARYRSGQRGDVWNHRAARKRRVCASDRLRTGAPRQRQRRGALGLFSLANLHPICTLRTTALT